MKWWGWGEEGETFDFASRPRLWPWIAARMGLDMKEAPELCEPRRPVVAPSRLGPRLIDQLRAALPDGDLLTDPICRVRHSFGRSYRDLLMLRRGHLSPHIDTVALPRRDDEVRSILEWARSNSAVVVPFGGGTNVAGCFMQSAEVDRPCIALNLRAMNRLLSVDSDSGVAQIQGGASGPEIEHALAVHGLALGHTPDSFEHSTLGGWIATRSSGTHSNRYGNIDDIVHSIRAVAPGGTIQTRPVPAASSGPSVREMLLGSEGALGVITEAAVRVHPLPQIDTAYGVLFRCFFDGLKAARALVTAGAIPDMVRLSDEAETELAAAMRSDTGSLFEPLFRRVLAAKGYSHPAVMIVGFHDAAVKLEKRWREVRSILRQFGGINLGEGPGRSWRRSRYELPYLRDSLLSVGVMAEVVETSATWSCLSELYERASQALAQSLKRFSPYAYIGCHVSHIYPTGASLYFTFASPQVPGKEEEQYETVKAAVTDAFIAHGGTLSHHHSVGREHYPWLEKEIGALGVRLLSGLKETLDPMSVLHGALFVPPRRLRRPETLLVK